MGVITIRKLPLILKIALIGIVLRITPAAMAIADEEEIESAVRHEFLFMIEEAYTQEKGQRQVCFTSQYMDRKKSKEGNELKITDQWQWMTEIEYGLSDWLQLEVEVPFANVHKKTIEDSETTHLDKAGIGDVETGIRIRLSEENEGRWWSPTVSAGFELTWPTGYWQKDLGTDRYGWEANLSLSKTIDNWAYHLTGGFGMTDDAREQSENEEVDVEEFKAGGALVYRPTDKLDFICELLAEFEKEESSSNRSHEAEFYMTPGIKHELFRDFEMGVGVPIGLTHESYDWAIVTKVQYEW